MMKSVCIPSLSSILLAVAFFVVESYTNKQIGAEKGSSVTRFKFHITYPEMPETYFWS